MAGVSSQSASILTAAAAAPARGSEARGIAAAGLVGRARVRATCSRHRRALAGAHAGAGQTLDLVLVGRAVGQQRTRSRRAWAGDGLAEIGRRAHRQQSRRGSRPRTGRRSVEAGLAASTRASGPSNQATASKAQASAAAAGSAAPPSEAPSGPGGPLPEAHAAFGGLSRASGPGPRRSPAANTPARRSAAPSQRPAHGRHAAHRGRGPRPDVEELDRRASGRGPGQTVSQSRTISPPSSITQHQALDAVDGHPRHAGAYGRSGSGCRPI